MCVCESESESESESVCVREERERERERERTMKAHSAKVYLYLQFFSFSLSCNPLNTPGSLPLRISGGNIYSVNNTHMTYASPFSLDIGTSHVIVSGMKTMAGHRPFSGHFNLMTDQPPPCSAKLPPTSVLCSQSRSKVLDIN